MSTRLESANSEGLIRTASVFNQNADYTWSVWYYAVTLGGQVQRVGAAASMNDCDEVFDIGGPLRMRGFDAAGAAIDFDDTGFSLSAGTFYYITLQRSGNTLKLYVDGVLALSLTIAVAGRAAAASMELGNRFNGSQFVDGRFAYSRIHSSALTAGEILAERTAAVPVLAAWANCPMTLHTDLTDTTGNGRGFTAIGTLSTEADPPAVVLGGGPQPVQPAAAPQHQALMAA